MPLTLVVTKSPINYRHGVSYVKKLLRLVLMEIFHIQLTNLAKL